MKNTYLLGISILVCLSILYLIWQQKKKIEQLMSLTNSIQPVPISNVLDKDSFYEETRSLHNKIETSYDRVYQQYHEVLKAVDNIPIVGNYEYTVEDNSENIKSYHGEDLIDINQVDKVSIDMNLEDGIPTSILGIAENTKKTQSTEQSDINRENHIADTEPSIISRTSLKQKSKSESDIHKEVSKKTIENNIVSLSVSSTVPKLPELKLLCKKNGLSPNGNKKEILERLSKLGITF